MHEGWDVLVVDDEAPARAKILRFLEEDPRFRIGGEAENGIEALEAARDHPPHLLILDIQMPGLTGFDVVEALEEPRPLVLFATAYDQHAMAAFEASAVDYLLKPFDRARFRRALDRAACLLGQGPPPSAPMTHLLADLSRRPLERFVVKVEDRWMPVPVRAVLRLTADGKKVKVHTESTWFHLRASLGELEARLDPRRFVRVHRGEIVALDAVLHLEPWDHGDALLVLKGGGKAVLSRTYRQPFLERWGYGL